MTTDREIIAQLVEALKPFGAGGPWGKVKAWILGKGYQDEGTKVAKQILKWQTNADAALEAARAALAAAERVAEPREPSEDAVTMAWIAFSKEPKEREIGGWKKPMAHALRAAYAVDGISAPISEHARPTTCSGVRTASGGAAAWSAHAPLPPVESGWMTMESAPKDGTTIIVFRPKIKAYGNIPHVGTDYWGSTGTRETWMLSNDYSVPTHWRPLPPPPEKEGGK